MHASKSNTPVLVIVGKRQIEPAQLLGGLAERVDRMVKDDGSRRLGPIKIPVESIEHLWWSMTVWLYVLRHCDTTICVMQLSKADEDGDTSTPTPLLFGTSTWCSQYGVGVPRSLGLYIPSIGTLVPDFMMTSFFIFDER